MKNVTINISLPESLLDAADKQSETELRNRSELVREALRYYLLQKNPSSTDSFSKAEIERVSEILNFADFQNLKSLVLSCAFRPQPNKIPDLFAGPDAKVTTLLENPPHFRYAGWDLQTLDRAKPVAGEYLQVANGIRKVIRVYRDGQVVLAGDEDFLGHGVNENKDAPFAFNGLAVAEVITNFTNFSQEVANLMEIKPSKLVFKIQLLNPKKSPVQLKNVLRGFPSHNPGIEIHLDLADREVVMPFDKDFKFEKAAYALLAEFYYFFGLSEDKFWYVRKETKEVNLESFQEK